MKTTLIVALIAGAVLRSDAQTACGDDVVESCTGAFLGAYTGLGSGVATPEQTCPLFLDFAACESDVGCDIDVSASLFMDAEEKATAILACACMPCLADLTMALSMGRRALSASSPWSGRQLQEIDPNKLCDALGGFVQCQEELGLDCFSALEGEDDGEENDDLRRLDEDEGGDMEHMAEVCAVIDGRDVDLACISTCPQENEPTCAQAETFFEAGECGSACEDGTKAYLTATLGCDTSAYATDAPDTDTDTDTDGVSAAGPSIALALVSSVFAYMGQQ